MGVFIIYGKGGGGQAKFTPLFRGGQKDFTLDLGRGGGGGGGDKKV